MVRFLQLNKLWLSRISPFAGNPQCVQLRGGGQAKGQKCDADSLHENLIFTQKHQTRLHLLSAEENIEEETEPKKKVSQEHSTKKSTL